MAFLTKRRALACKVEAVEGVAEALTTAEVVYVENVKWSPNTETLKRNPHLTTLGDIPPVAGRSQASVSFQVHKYGGSAAGTAPFWGTLLKGSGFGETIVASTSVTYKPVSTGYKSLTIEIDMDGIAYRIRGARGNVSEEMLAGQIPVFSFTFEGLWDPTTDAGSVVDKATLVGSAFPSFLPKAFKSALLIVDGYKAITENLKWNVSNKLTRVPEANVSNFKRVDIVDRAATGEIDAEAVTQATYNFVNKMATKAAFQISSFTGADDSGNGTGSLNTLTDATKNWIASQWASGYSLRDSAGTVFAITASTATTLTVSGTPASGDYTIYQVGKLIQEIMPKCVFDTVNDTDKNGIYNFSLPFGAYINAGDDEIQIIVT